MKTDGFGYLQHPTDLLLPSGLMPLASEFGQADAESRTTELVDRTSTKVCSQLRDGWRTRLSGARDDDKNTP